MFGAVERGGRVRADGHPDSRAATLDRRASTFVLPSSTVFTDECVGVRPTLGQGLHAHHRINHSEKVYVSGNVHTQTIEGFWALLKSGITAPTTPSPRSIFRVPERVRVAVQPPRGSSPMFKTLLGSGRSTGRVTFAKVGMKLLTLDSPSSIGADSAPP